MSATVSQAQQNPSPAAMAGARAPTEREEIVITPRRGWIGIDWAELWRYRELLYFLAWRDVKIRYKQTIFGILWAFIQPFMRMVVFSVFFGRLAKMDSEGFPYPIFVYAGLLPWQFFSEALRRSASSLVSSSNLITKVYFPRLIVPLAAIGGCLVDFSISFGILVGLMLYYGITLTVAIAMVLPLVLLTVMVALGVGTLFSALTVAYRDFRYVLGFGIQMWMFLTPIIYPVRIVPERWQWLLFLNPMSGIVDGYRSAILGKPFQWESLAISVVVTLVLLTFAAAYFRRTEKQFADII